MAFQDDVRAEMLVPIVEDMCCEKAALATAILASGGVSFAGLGKIHLTVASGRATVVRRFFEIAKTCCGASGELRAAKTEKLSKTTRYELHLDADTLVDQLGLSDPDSLFGIRQTPVLENPCCVRAALRAAFLLTGYVADPQTEYRLEFALHNAAMADFVREILQNEGFPAKGVCRRGQFVVYLNGMETVSDVLTLLGATNSMMKLQNTSTMKSISNEIHRQINCDESNINRALTAAEAQVRAIETIMRVAGLASLTPPLRDIAQARLDNPNAPLSELGAMMDPPLGKSSVNSRIRRLMDIAEKMVGTEQYEA